MAVMAVVAGGTAFFFSQTVPVGHLRPPYEVLIYDNGRPVIERPIAPGSQEVRAVITWLQAHPTGWRFDLISYCQEFTSGARDSR